MASFLHIGEPVESRTTSAHISRDNMPREWRCEHLHPLCMQAVTYMVRPGIHASGNGSRSDCTHRQRNCCKGRLRVVACSTYNAHKT